MDNENQTGKKHKKEKNSCAANLMPRDAKTQRLLHDRALRFAKQEVKETEIENAVLYIRFRLGVNEYYGIPYHTTKEVMQKTILTKVPRVPDFVAGIINRHGMLLTVLDLKKFFRIPMPEYDKNAYIIIITEKNMTVGILADHIVGSDVYDPATLDAPLSSAGIIKPEYIIGLHQGITAIINMEAILSDLKLQLKKQA